MNRITRGEQAIWGIIHMNVWNTGIALKYQLDKQNLVYIDPSLELSDDEYKIADELINEGKFLIDAKNQTIIIDSMAIKPIRYLTFKEIQISLEPKAINCKGLLVTKKKEKTEPQIKKRCGWVASTTSKKTLTQSSTQDLLRVIRIAKGGFYELTAAQQKIQQSGLLENNGLGLFQQNQAFNAMLPLFREMEQTVDFDPSQLNTPDKFKAVSNRLAMHFKKGDLMDDFLVGDLITQVIQPIMASQPHSTRMELPVRFRNPLASSMNATRILAHQYQLRDKAGRLLFKLESKKTPKEDKGVQIIDDILSGEMLLPNLDKNKHFIALLSAQIITCEQMLLEQFLPGLVNQSITRDTWLDLNEIIENDKILHLLMSQKATLDKEGRLVLGLQSEECAELVTEVRRMLGTDQLIDLCRNFSKHPDGVVDEHFDKLSPKEKRGIWMALKKLRAISRLIRKHETTHSAKHPADGLEQSIRLISLKTKIKRVSHDSNQIAVSYGSPAKDSLKLSKTVLRTSWCTKLMKQVTKPEVLAAASVALVATASAVMKM